MEVKDKEEQEELKRVDHVERMLTDIIETIGYKNRWHLFILFGVGMVVIQDGGNMLWSVFAAAHIPHRCWIPGLGEGEFATVPPEVIDQVFFTDPNSFGCKGVPADRERGCTALDTNPVLLLEESQSLNLTLAQLLTSHRNMSRQLITSEYKRCDQMKGFEFMPNEIEDSATKEFGLICGGEIYRRIDKALFVFGQSVGAFALGYLSDKYGRKSILILQYFLEIFFILALAVSNNIAVFLTLRFIVSLFNMSKFPIAVTFGAEVMMPQHRGMIGMIPGIEIGIGMILYSFFAYLIKSWRLFTTTGMWFSIPVMVYWLIVMPESPRWLLEQGKFREFKRIATNIERKTKKQLDPKMWQRLDDLIQTQRPNRTLGETIKAIFAKKSKDVSIDKIEEKTSGFAEIGKSPLLKRWLFVFVFVWCANTLLYYALTMGQDLFNLNIYSFTLINGCFEMAGVLLIMLAINIIGRRASMMGGLFMCGVSLALCQLFHDDQMLKQLFASCSKLFITGTFDMAFLYTGEVMPTLSRTTGVGICSGICRVVGMGFPFIDMLNSYIPGSSLIFMMVLAVLGALACFLLPETKGQELPETVEDCKLLAKRKLQKVHIKSTIVLSSTEEEPVNNEKQGDEKNDVTNC
ncbi:solute carrier family 22 member 13-like [Convolutriloba macropyga]|uniref:solute carrier family 22 member 13-like n=1 Tax=Convolutriloba macropyga TaxID=536237 RepID=UPI003F51CB66